MNIEQYAKSNIDNGVLNWKMQAADVSYQVTTLYKDPNTIEKAVP